jgi:UDP-N-acetylglucosamine kinase
MNAIDQDIANKMLAEAKLDFKLDELIPPDNKIMIILGGQPGAGKSTITDIIEKQFKGNILVLNGDDVKLYFPNYTALLAKDPDTTAKLVQPYSNFVIDNLKQDAIAKNLNILVEGTMRTASTPINTIHEAFC